MVDIYKWIEAVEEYISGMENIDRRRTALTRAKSSEAEKGLTI